MTTPVHTTRSTSAVRPWGPALSAVGTVLTALGVVVALPIFGASPSSMAVAALGASLLVVGGIMTPSSSAASSSASRASARIAPIAVVVVGAVLLWASSHTRALEIDVTYASANTLADESIIVATGLGYDVEIVSFVEDDRALLELRTLVDRYRAVTPRITFEQRSVKRADDLERARVLGVAEYLALGGPNVVVVRRDSALPPVRLRWSPSMPDDEQLLTNALRRVTTTSTTRVYLLSGHGEPDTRDEGPVGLSRLTTSLEARGVQLVPLPLVSVGVVPDDARALMLLPPTTPVSDAERALIVAAVARGVPIVIAVEPGQPSPLATQIAASFGVDVVDDVVVDESPFSTLLGGADMATGQTQMAHAVTRSLRGALTHFPRSALLGITPLGQGDEANDVVVTPIVSTGADARAHVGNARGPLPLVVAVERVRPAARAIVAADASFLLNASTTTGANADLALNAMLWVTGTDDAIAVRAHRKTGGLVFLTPAARERLSFVALVVLPGLLLALAAARGAWRGAR
jgi:hypothetical protein